MSDRKEPAKNDPASTENSAMRPEDKKPMPGKEYEDQKFPTSWGEETYHETGTRPFTVRHNDYSGPDSVPRQPNDRDESPDSQASAPREVIKQAYKDVMQGQVDTDLREQRGVEKTVDKPFTPAKEMPQKHGRS